jgi:hypothetical protein
MIPASYLFKDVHERHWGTPARRSASAEDAYYASLGSGPIATLRLWRGFKALMHTMTARDARPRASQASSDVACRA